MRRLISRGISSCDVCNKTKASLRAWRTITMDFITKLPKSVDPTTGKEYDSILVVVDKLTKWSYFIQ